ncbi:MAG: hypothetical protein V4689_19095 [Verrucomicrobiota bacterium]
MSRSYHVTNKQLVQERIENTLAGFDDTHATELEEKDIKKDIAKVNAAWTKQAERDGLRPGWKMRLKDQKIEVI